MTRALSNLGAGIGNWNDRHNSGDSRTTRRRPRTWQALDRLSSLLYVLPDGLHLALRAARRQR